MSPALTASVTVLDFLAGAPAAPATDVAPEAAPQVRGFRPWSLRALLARRAGQRALDRHAARLEALSPHLLDDVGLGAAARPESPRDVFTTGGARCYARRTVWDAPDHWFR